MKLSAPEEYLNTGNGDKSSKRFWGNKLLTIGTCLGLILFACNIILAFFKIEISLEANKTCYQILALFYGTGGSLLFGGVFDKLKEMSK